MARLKVGVLFGGQSVEHEVSLISAGSILNALDTAKYEVVPLAITKDGRWLASRDAAALLPSGGPSFGSTGLELPGPKAVAATNQPRGLLPALDVVFPVVHGTNGEDGTLQGLLELAGVPYVGAGVAASAVGMDKALMKSLFRDAGIPIARHEVVLRADFEAAAAETALRIRGGIGLPCFVKPANGGSSVGVSHARTSAALLESLGLAFRLDRKVLVEEAITGRELECSVLGNDRPEASAVGEIITSHDFYDYDAKYRDNSTRLEVPAAVPAEVANRVRELAVRAFQAIDCAGMARVDCFYRSSDGAVLVNEINTIPGFTPMSMYPRMWEAAGLPYPALLDRLIDLALQRHEDRKRSRSDIEAVRRAEAPV
ncbi:MAG: D-alanine--D-alanine ligase [Dehalococcoidia bacterium]|nr:D-alanine--D-alanine ligase [Dehalococcoidia bacterium]